MLFDKPLGAFDYKTPLEKLLPSYFILPEDFRQQNEWTKLVDTWFFRGLDAKQFRPKPGIDGHLAWRHLSHIMSSFEPKHEHKIAGVAWLMSRWFERINGEMHG